MQSNSKLKKNLGSSSSRSCCYERTTKALLELGLARKNESTALSGVEIGPWESQDEDQHNNKNVLNSLNKYNAAVLSKQQQPSAASVDEKQQQQKRQEVSNLILKRRTLSQQRPSDALNEKKKKQMMLVRNEGSPLRNYIIQQVTAAVAQQQSPPQRRLLSQEQMQQLIEKQQQWRQQQQQQQFQEQQNILLQREQQFIENSEMQQSSGQQYEFQQQQVQILQSQQQELMRLKMTDGDNMKGNNNSSGTKQKKHMANEKKYLAAQQEEGEDCQMIQQANQDLNNIRNTEEFIQQQFLVNASRTSSKSSSLDNLKYNPQQSPQKVNTSGQQPQEYEQHQQPIAVNRQQQQQGQFKQYHQQTNSYQPKLQQQQQQQQQRNLEDKMQQCELQRLETFKKNILFKCLSHHGQKPLLSLDLLRNSKTSPLKKSNHKSTTTMANTTGNNPAVGVVNNLRGEESQIEVKNTAERSPDGQGSSTNRAIAAVESNECSNSIACSVVASVCETVISQPKQILQQQLQQEQIPDCLKKRTRSHHIPMYVSSAKGKQGDISRQQPQDESNLLVAQYCQTEAYDEAKRVKKSSESNNNNILKTEETEDVIVKRRIHSLYSQNIEAQLADEAALIYHTNNDDQHTQLRYHGNTFTIKSNKPQNALRNSELFKINRSIDIVHQLKQLQLTNPDKKRIILNAKNSNNRTACNMKIGNSKWEFIEETKNNRNVKLKQNSAVYGEIAPMKYGLGMGDQKELQQGRDKSNHAKVKEIDSRNQKDSNIQRYPEEATTDENKDSKEILTSETKLTTQQSMNVHSLSNILAQQEGDEDGNSPNVIRSNINSDKHQKDKQQQGDKMISCCDDVISRDSHVRKRMPTEGDVIFSRSVDKSARYQKDNQKKFELLREQSNGIIGNNNNYCQKEMPVGKQQQQSQYQNSQDTNGFTGGYDAKTSLENSAAFRQKEKRPQRCCDDYDEPTNIISAKQPTTSSCFGQQDDQQISMVDYQTQQQKTYQSPRLPNMQVSRKQTLPAINSKSKSPERTRICQEGRNYQPLQYLEEQRCQLPLVSSNRDEKNIQQQGSIGACMQQDNKGSNVVSLKQIEQLSSQIQLSAAKKLKFKLLNKKNDTQI